MRPSPRTGLAMSHALDPGQSHRTADAGLPAARAHRAEPDTAYYVDREGVVVRTYSNTGYPNAMGHRRDLRSRRVDPTLAVAFVAACSGVLASAVTFVVLLLVWR